MGNTVFSWTKKLTEIWYLLITEKFLFWNFRWLEIQSFFESRSWWKDGIYWLLRSSCFELFGHGKYGFFSAKKLMERLYVGGLFEISKIFHDLGNIVFRAVIVSNVDIIWFNLKTPQYFSRCFGTSFLWNLFRSKIFLSLF